MELKLYTAPLAEVRGWSNIKPVMLFMLVDGRPQEVWTQGDEVPMEWLFNPPEDIYATYYYMEDDPNANL